MARKTLDMSRRHFMAATAKAAAGAVVAGSMAGCSASGGRRGADFDVIIRGGTVYDGSLNDPVVVDIGVRGDRIAAVGAVAGRAATELDARGCLVTPGFIDVHTHCDLTFQRTGAKRLLAYLLPSWKGNHNYLYQGVTTVITGNCGLGYPDTDRWLDMVDTLGFGTNVGHLAPHGNIRMALFGDRQPRELTPAQLDAMKGRLADELGKGAFGMSTGLEYAPGLNAGPGELVALARVLRDRGGIYTTHMRDESGRRTDDGDIAVLASIRETVDLCRRAEAPVEISHLKISAPFQTVQPEQLLERIDAARRQGLPVTCDQYPYAAGSTTLDYLLPHRFKAPRGGVLPAFRNPDGRHALRQAAEDIFEVLGPDKILITMHNEQPAYEGKTLDQIAEMCGQPATEVFSALVTADEVPMAVFFAQDMDVVRALMDRPYMITASDGWTVPKNMTHPHPRVYGTFPRKLRRFAMEEKIVSLTQAIRSMTSLPADTFKIVDRGRIAEGAFADIAVVDAATLGDHATYTRPHQYATGIVHLLVNGVLSIEDRRATGDRGGRALRRA